MASIKIIHSQTLVVEEVYETVIEVEDDFDVDSANLLFLVSNESWGDPVDSEVLDVSEENIIEWEWV